MYRNDRDNGVAKQVCNAAATSPDGRARTLGEMQRTVETEDRLSRLEAQIQKVSEVVHSALATGTRRNNQYRAQIENLHREVFELRKQVAVDQIQHLAYEPFPEVE